MYQITLYLTFLAVAITQVSCKCSDVQTNAASANFKDCMDEKQLALLQVDANLADKQQYICDGLGDLAAACQPAVDSLAGCKGREYVDNVVNIHINSVAGILASFHPDVDLRDCPVLVTQPPPTIVHTDNSGRDGEAGANPAYVTSDTKHSTVAAAIMLVTCFISRIL